MIPKLSAAYYAVRLMVHSSNINTLKNNLQHIRSFYHRIWNNFWGVILPTVGYLHFLNENLQNYGWCTTQNLRYKSI